MGNKRGKAGEPTPKQNNTRMKAERANTGARGAKRTRLSDIEKVLLVNGGIGHRLRRPPKARASAKH